MTANIIQLLPDSIANQIAAGEVIQRPASAVKELLENAVDANATEIRLIIKDAGKVLIQVIDNGIGMSVTDARLCFERHATSKIKTAADLFKLRTMGFRGEALASIAAIAQVELKTRRAEDTLGTCIVIEGFEVKSQEPIQTAVGSQISVKNLFYNVPARRNFLKSFPVETKHILDEFTRVALANPQIFFSLHNNEDEIYHLPAGNLKTRIASLFGKDVIKKIVAVEEDTDILKIDGFIGKSEFARKTRGEQFFFVNDRFIKSSYLNHAVMTAYQDILPKDAFPFYVLFLEINPERIDVNVHPTKQEIKFEDERTIYTLLLTSLKHSLGKYAVKPSLDFEAESEIVRRDKTNYTVDTTKSEHTRNVEAVRAVSGFQPKLDASNLKNWQKLYDGIATIRFENSEPDAIDKEMNALNVRGTFKVPRTSENQKENLFKAEEKQFSAIQQLYNNYILVQTDDNYLLLDQHLCSERVLFEYYLESLTEKPATTQTILFPIRLHLSAQDSVLLQVLSDELQNLGFDIRSDTEEDIFSIHGYPSHLNAEETSQNLLEILLENYKSDVQFSINSKERLAASLARTTSVKRNKNLSKIEMQNLVERLFTCQSPNFSPDGKKCFIELNKDFLEQQFE